MSGQTISSCLSVIDLGVTIAFVSLLRRHVLDILSLAGRVASFILRGFVLKTPSVHLTAYSAFVVSVISYPCKSLSVVNLFDVRDRKIALRLHHQYLFNF